VKADYTRNPGGRGPFSYCTAGVFLLGQVVQRATQQPLDRYFDARLLRPLGIRERQWARSPAGEFQSGGGLRLRSRDLLKLGVLIMGNGNWRGAQLVPEPWVRRMQHVSNVVNEQQSYGMRCPAPPAELLLQDLRLAGPVQIDQRLGQLEFNVVPEALPRAIAVHARAAHEAQRRFVERFDAAAAYQLHARR
jgi:CubicO group peptidase (beta-lactamase class C family)